MISRIRIEGSGHTAAECEQHMLAVFNLIEREIDPLASTGDQHIERHTGDAGSAYEHQGRLLVYLNVAGDSAQHEWLAEHGPEAHHEGAVGNGLLALGVQSPENITH